MKHPFLTPQWSLTFLQTALLAWFLASMPSHADVLYNNGPADLTNGAETFNAESGDYAGDVFTPSVSGQATSVNFAGVYFLSNTPSTSDSFSVSLYSVSAGVPTTLIETSALSGISRTVDGTGGEFGDYTVYNYSGSIVSPFFLTAGSSYYLGFSDTTSPNEEYNMAYSTGPANALYELSDGSFYPEQAGNALSFEVNGTIESPEPGTWALLLMGLAVTGWIYRQRTSRWQNS